MDYLKVLWLPPAAPSIIYRPWADRCCGTSLLRWFITRLVNKYGNHSLLIACHSELDRSLAEIESDEAEIFVTASESDTLTGLMGELGLAFPERPIAWFSPEMMFAPSGLLDRVALHHESRRNNFTWVEDLPSRMCPQIADPRLLVSIAAIEYEGYVPDPRELAVQLASVRQEPFAAASFYSIPDFAHMPRLRSTDEVDRAWQAVTDHPETDGFERVLRWQSARFEPPQFQLPSDPPDGFPRVLYLSPGSFYSGAEDCLRGLAEGLTALNFSQTAVVAMQSVLSERMRQAGCAVVVPNWDFRAPTDVNTRFATKVLRTVRPHIVNCNADPGPAFVTGARAENLPVIAHVRTTTFPHNYRFHNDVEAIIAVSQFTKQCLVESGVPADKVTVIYEGVDTRRFVPGVFDKAVARRRFQLPPNAFIVLMIARVAQLKRHDIMLDAFDQFARIKDNAHLVIVGKYGEPDILSSIPLMIAERGLKQRVTWLSFQHDIREIECAADVLVLPSDREALGFCVLEAMSLGLPAVVSDNGGSSELIEDGVSGLTMSGGEPGSLAQRLTQLANSETLQRDIGQQARLHVERCFSLRRHFEQVAAYFQAILRTTCSSGDSLRR